MRFRYWADVHTTRRKKSRAQRTYTLHVFEAARPEAVCQLRQRR